MSEGLFLNKFHSSSKIYGLKAQKQPAQMKLLKEASVFTRKRSILLLNSEAEMSVHTVVSGTEYYITLEAPSHRRNKILKLFQRNQPHQHRPIKTQITSSPFSSSACIIQLSISQGKKCYGNGESLRLLFYFPKEKKIKGVKQRDVHYSR